MEVQNLEGMVEGLLVLAGNAVAAGAFVYGIIKYHSWKDSRETKEATYELKTR